MTVPHEVKLESGVERFSSYHARVKTTFRGKARRGKSCGSSVSLADLLFSNKAIAVATRRYLTRLWLEIALFFARLSH